MPESEVSDPDLLPELHRFIAQHPRTCNAYVDMLLRRALAELDRHQPEPVERNRQ